MVCYFTKPIDMKLLLTVIYFLISAVCFAQSKKSNVFIITTDGFRWEELFKGADSSLINNSNYVKDTSLTKQMFWDVSDNLRRQKLMPFFWNVIAKKGQLFGNRNLDNKVNVKNLYKISYPGYNEILTGYADPIPILNAPVQNKNYNVLEFLNKQSAFKGKVAAFSSWNIMPYIFNEERSGFTVNSGYEMLNDKNELSEMIDSVQKNARKSKTRNDGLTYLSAKEYIEQHHPKVLFLGLGETDECAHEGRYDLYLQKAAAFDKMVADLWYYIQTDPFYKDNTSLIITTDHGRGKKGKDWRTHGFWIKGSGETWMAMMGPEILPEGEINIPQQIWQKQIAATIATLAGENFVTKQHSIAPSINIAVQPSAAIMYTTKVL